MQNEPTKPTETTGRYHEVRLSSPDRAHESSLVAEFKTFPEADTCARRLHAEGQRNVFVRPPTTTR